MNYVRKKSKGILKTIQLIFYDMLLSIACTIISTSIGSLGRLYQIYILRYIDPTSDTSSYNADISIVISVYSYNCDNIFIFFFVSSQVHNIIICLHLQLFTSLHTCRTLDVMLL